MTEIIAKKSRNRRTFAADGEGPGLEAFEEDEEDFLEVGESIA